MSTIFRTNKNKNNPFVMLDKRPVENPELSWSAKGMLAYLMSRPDGWEVVMQDLVNRSKDGEYAVRTTVKELISAGHLVMREERNEAGQFVRTVYDVYEEPISQFPASGFPASGKSRASNTDSSNTEINNTNDMANGEKPAVANLPIEWQIAAGKEITKMPDNDDAKYVDAANLIAMPFGGQAEQARGIALAFMRERKILIPNSKIKAQRKAVKEMLEMGVRADHVAEAVWELQKNNMTIVDLYSVSKTAINLANLDAGSQTHSKFEGV